MLKEMYCGKNAAVTEVEDFLKIFHSSGLTHRSHK